jgi:hypothetical protein
MRPIRFFAILLVMLLVIIPPAVAEVATTDVWGPSSITSLSEKPSKQLISVAPSISPDIHYAYNVEGRNSNDTKLLVISDAAAKQESIKYIPIIRERPPRSSIKASLPRVGLFFFHGHGEPGRIQTDDVSGEFYCARGDPDGYNIDTIGSLSDLKLALLLGCSAGSTSSQYGNLVDSVYKKGGACAMGFTQTIFAPGEAHYSQVFWNGIVAGSPYLDAHKKAVVSVKTTYKEDKQCAGEKKCNGTCCLDQMYSKGCNGGLTLPPEIIDLEQGRAIAEAVARSNNPDLFQDSSTHKLTFGSDINDRGDGGREFNYHWAEYLNYPDKFTEPHLVIRGLNDTHIVLSPYTGEILSQWGWSAPLDPTLSLNPTVTNDQALEIAKVFAATQFFTIPGRTPEPKDWTTEGLLVMYPYAKSEAKTQHLAWGFEVRHHSAGGLVYVDAYDGSILGSNEMV